MRNKLQEVAINIIIFHVHAYERRAQHCCEYIIIKKIMGDNIKLRIPLDGYLDQPLSDLAAVKATFKGEKLY